MKWRQSEGPKASPTVSTDKTCMSGIRAVFQFKYQSVFSAKTPANPEDIK